MKDFIIHVGFALFVAYIVPFIIKCCIEYDMTIGEALWGYLEMLLEAWDDLFDYFR